MMAAATDSTSLVPVQPMFTDAERLALAGYLAGYRGLTREAYTLDLRQFTGWCRARSVPLFSVRRADIETFARELEGRGRARATVTRRLSTIAGFYRYAVEEELLDHSPAAHVRRPRVDYESHATALDRNEVGALLVAAGLGAVAEHALISLLPPFGYRRPPVPTSSTWVWNAGTGPSSSPARAARSSRSRSPRAPPAPSTWPLASAPAGHCSAPRMGNDWTGTAPRGSSAVSPAGQGLASRSARTRFGTRSSPPHSMRESRCVTCRRPPRTPTRAPPCATTGRAPASTATQPTSSRPTSREPPGSPRLRWSWPDRPVTGQAMTPGQTAIRVECHTGTLISPSVTGSMRELYGFELEPEVRDWLDSLSDSDYKRVDEVCGLLAEKGSELGGPWSDHLEGSVWELRLRLRDVAARVTYWCTSGGRIVLLTVFRKTRQHEQRQIDRAVRAQKTCERDHRGPATETYERQV